MRQRVLVLLVFVGSACDLATSPATHSPLRERLAAADTPAVEEAARDCLAKGGWKVDPVGGLSQGANVVSASNAKEHTNVYIQAAEVKPRVSGGPPYDDPFWKCIAGELSSSKTPAATPSADDTP